MSPAHPPEPRLRELARGHPPLAAEAAHLDRCRACHDELTVLNALWLDPERVSPSLACLDASLLVRSAEGARLSASEKRRLRQHLPGCDRCAGELEALERAAEGARAFPSRSKPEATRTSLVARLQALLGPSMPTSLALAARGAGSRLPGFQRAMRSYRRGRFAEARELLAAAEAAGERAPEIGFYLGCCWLEAGEPARAAASLKAAAALRPRAGEYRYYLAQALLGQGKLRAALGELERAAALPGVHRARARKALAEARATSGTGSAARG